MTSPVRGFSETEFERRVARAQNLMGKSNIDALLLTTPADFYYFTGFLTRFWESPTRPWFLIIPQVDEPIAVIPSIGEDLMASTWISDIRTWRSPDMKDDGISLLVTTLSKYIAPRGQLAMPMGSSSYMRLPLEDFKRLESVIAPATICSDAGIVRRLRLIKSDAEIDKIEMACEIAGRSFARVHEFAVPGAPLDEVFRKFQMTCLEEGADWVSYLAGGAGQGGYTNVISPARQVPLEVADILMLDTGLVWDGYFCDFDRNFAIGRAEAADNEAYLKLIDAAEASFHAARPGVMVSDIFHTMNSFLSDGLGFPDVGRMGHGLGIQLTEWPSLMPDDHTVLEEGMVLTLEPAIQTADGKMLVHEENIVITRTGARMLSSRASKTLPVIGEPQ